jgi:hypothetical protein
MYNMRYLITLLFALSFHAKASAQQAYELKPEESHFILLIPNDKMALSLELATEVSKYNALFHLNDQLIVKRYKMDYLSSKGTICISGFDNLDIAQKYWAQVLERSPDFNKGDMILYAWPISTSNFNTLIQNKDKQSYLNFIDQNGF